MANRNRNREKLNAKNDFRTYVHAAVETFTSRLKLAIKTFSVSEWF